MLPLIFGIAFAVGAVLFFMGIDGVNRQRALAAGGEIRQPRTLRQLIDDAFEATEQRAAKRQANAGKLTLAEQLSRADLKIRTSEWQLIRIGSAALLFLIADVRFGFLSGIIQAVIAGVIGYFAPQVYLGWKQSQRLKAFNDQLGDTLVLMANALKTGYSMAQALDVVANKASPPMSQEFDRVVKEVNLGASIEDAMNRMVRRTESADLDMVNTAMSISRKIGGNLSEILETISETIRERVRIKGEMQTMTAQARSSGYLITGLPIVLGVFMYFVTPTYFGPMLSSPIGIGMLVAAGIFMGLGQFIMSRIAQVDV